MTTSRKVEIKIGDMSFSGEGDQEWLDKQITKLLAAAAAGSIPSAAPGVKPASASSDEEPSTVGSLASFIKAAGGGSKQVQRFLATAGWLFKRGETSLTTASVSKALSDNHQKKLGNPADCLNQNVTKGYCEKTADGFFITPEGWEVLGVQA